MNAPQGPRIGSLCSGYEGLGAAIQEVLGGDLAFVADPDPGAAKILAHHHPDVPNLGDITQVDWANVPRVDVLIGGTPCQDVSVAGRGAGMHEHTRSGLWFHMARAIKILRPSLVVFENVPGIRTRPAHSDVEPCPWCGGNQRTEPVLRALGAVLGGLADLRFDAEWVSVPASAVGAPHRRERVFVLAWPSDAPRPRLEAWRQGRPGGTPAPENPNVAAGGERRVAAPRQEESGRARADARGRGGAPAAHADRHPLRQQPVTLPWRGGTAVAELDGVAGEAPAHADGGTVLTVPHSEPAGPETHHEHHRVDTPGRFLGWGAYGDAIHRWEHVLGRPAPLPTEPGRNGQPRLNPRFVEWMQGLDDGWVTSPDIGLKRNDQLRALGNGVVPQQGAHALRLLLDRAFPAAVNA